MSDTLRHSREGENPRPTEAHCQLQLSPDCAAPEVVADCPPYFTGATACIPCGKAFQDKFPHAIGGLSLRPMPETLR